MKKNRKSSYILIALLSLASLRCDTAFRVSRRDYCFPKRIIKNSTCAQSAPEVCGALRRCRANLTCRPTRSKYNRTCVSLKFTEIYETVVRKRTYSITYTMNCQNCGPAKEDEPGMVPASRN